MVLIPNSPGCLSCEMSHGDRIHRFVSFLVGGMWRALGIWYVGIGWGISLPPLPYLSSAKANVDVYVQLQFKLLRFSSWGLLIPFWCWDLPSPQEELAWPWEFFSCSCPFWFTDLRKSYLTYNIGIKDHNPILKPSHQETQSHSRLRMSVKGTGEQVSLGPLVCSAIIALGWILSE